jgi:hypothetical protein
LCFFLIRSISLRELIERKLLLCHNKTRRKSKDRSKTGLLFSITKYKINQDRNYVTTKLEVNRRIDQRQVYLAVVLLNDEALAEPLIKITAL